MQARCGRAFDMALKHCLSCLAFISTFDSLRRTPLRCDWLHVLLPLIRGTFLNIIAYETLCTVAELTWKS